MPEGSRGALPGYEWLQQMLVDEGANAKVRRLKAVSDELGCTLAQMSIAWCATNPHVSSVITGASRVAQVHENLKAAQVIPLLTPDVLARIEEITTG